MPVKDSEFDFSKLCLIKSMISTNSMTRLLIALIISIAILFSLANFIIQTMPKESLNLKTEIDRFLTAIPPDYYTIASVEGLKTLLKDSQAVLVDVREPSEYRSGYIPNAINIPLRTLAQSLDQIPRDRPVVIYCASGYRSAMGVTTLHLLGYEKVQGFPPSFAGWKAAGETIAKS